MWLEPIFFPEKKANKHISLNVKPIPQRKTSLGMGVRFVLEFPPPHAPFLITDWFNSQMCRCQNILLGRSAWTTPPPTSESCEDFEKREEKKIHRIVALKCNKPLFPQWVFSPFVLLISQKTRSLQLRHAEMEGQLFKMNSTLTGSICVRKNENYWDKISVISAFVPVYCRVWLNATLKRVFWMPFVSLLRKLEIQTIKCPL